MKVKAVVKHFANMGQNGQTEQAVSIFHKHVGYATTKG